MMPFYVLLLWHIGFIIGTDPIKPAPDCRRRRHSIRGMPLNIQRRSQTCNHMHSRGGSFLGAILCFFCAVGRDRPRGQRTIVIWYTNENKKESMGNQLPPTHFLEEVVVIQTGLPVDCAWGPVFHGMQIINHHHSDPQECLMTQ